MKLIDKLNETARKVLKKKILHNFKKKKYFDIKTGTSILSSVCDKYKYTRLNFLCIIIYVCVKIIVLVSIYMYTFSLSK